MICIEPSDGRETASRLPVNVNRNEWLGMVGNGWETLYHHHREGEMLPLSIQMSRWSKANKGNRSEHGKGHGQGSGKKEHKGKRD